MLHLNEIVSGYKKDNPILKNVSLQIDTGKICVLIGPNGSGKSTLLRTALGILFPYRGEVFFGGKRLTDLSLGQRAHSVSLLESQMQITFAMTVGELLEISSRRHTATEKTELVEKALELLDLKPFVHRNVQELSHGEAKRALIAHALVGFSKVIMLDEPFASLDWPHQEILVRALKQWRSLYGTSFLISMHEFEWMLRLADDCFVLDRGKLVKHGSAEQILQTAEVGNLFGFEAKVDKNPIDGSPRLTLGLKTR